jgi:predicted nicotinamide N-methyase
MSKWEMKEPYIGAHIRVQIQSIYHHGIYIGNNEVIQFGLLSDMLKPKEEVKVLVSSIEEFLQGGFLEVRVFDRKERKIKNDDLKIVEIAKSKLGEDGYDIVHNNCEHFANFCIFNKKESKQIDDIRSEIRKKLGIKK